MTKVFNIKKNEKLRKKLRKNQTKAEEVLWRKIKNKQINGCKFRRQFGIEKYVIDFYCPKLKLAIEIDGDSHFYGKQLKNDANREKEIEQYGVKILRFMNVDVRDNLKNVLNVIWEECERKKRGL